MITTGTQIHLSKSCFKCGAEKPLTEFYRHSAMADGHLNKCKTCTKKDSAKHREENLESVQAYDRNRPNREKRNEERGERLKRDYAEDPDKFLERQRKYRAEEPEKYRARNAVSNAVRDGRLFRPDHCTACGTSCIPEGHHPSYEVSEWLTVDWLCSSCHHDLHAGKLMLTFT